jgi:hypothetical protein
MLLQRVWGVRRLKNVRRLGMLGGTLASCALALATVVPSAYALACGSQNHHKTTQTSNSHHIHKTTQTTGSQVHETSTVRYVYVYKCSCKKDHHSSSTNHHGSDNHSSNSDSQSTTSHHGSSGGKTSGNSTSGKTSGNNTNGGSSQPVQPGTSVTGSGTTPRLPLTGSDPESL